MSSKLNQLSKIQWNGTLQIMQTIVGIPTFPITKRHLAAKTLIYVKIMFIFSTPVLTRQLWQLKKVVFLHRCLICAVLLYQHVTCLALNLLGFQTNVVKLVFRTKVIGTLVFLNALEQKLFVQQSFRQQSFRQQSFRQQSFRQQSFTQQSFRQKQFKQKSFEQKSFEQKTFEQKSLEQKSFEQKSLEKSHLNKRHLNKSLSKKGIRTKGIQTKGI